MAVQSIPGRNQKLLGLHLGLKMLNNMPTYNIINNLSIEENYQSGLLPQRNSKNTFYQDSSSRANLANFSLSSENRRILKKTEDFSFEKIDLKQVPFDLKLKKTIFNWIKGVNWDFPISSVETIFTNHIFNYIYVWKDENKNIVAYGLCYFSSEICHIAYVFYDPAYDHQNLPIRMVLQVIIDSYNASLKFCYLGRFSQTIGFYKRNMPGFEYFDGKQWIEYNKDGLTL
jgi:arginyl-tRNA--protein-N-Asp/Glu arginylyltransferase